MIGTEILCAVLHRLHGGCIGSVDCDRGCKHWLDGFDLEVAMEHVFDEEQHTMDEYQYLFHHNDCWSIVAIVIVVVVIIMITIIISIDMIIISIVMIYLFRFL